MSSPCIVRSDPSSRAWPMPAPIFVVSRFRRVSRVPLEKGSRPSVLVLRTEPRGIGDAPSSRCHQAIRTSAESAMLSPHEAINYFLRTSTGGQLMYGVLI